jgi:hypothetical protein
LAHRLDQDQGYHHHQDASHSGIEAIVEDEARGCIRRRASG